MPRIKWLVGLVLFSGVTIGAFYGALATRTPWWSWACIAFIAFSVLRLVPARIRNGYWGTSPSASAWEQIKTEKTKHE